MAAPEFVPIAPVRSTAQAYVSPPRRSDSWVASRPGEVVGAPQPEGGALGYQGPDQGYALGLAELFRDRLALADDESADDAIAGCLSVALRRASMFGRAPVVHDLRIAFTLFGFLDSPADPALVAWRRGHFAGLAGHHHYVEGRHLASMVPEETLRMTPAQVEAEHLDGWRGPLGL
jgi:hypothetical protein